MLQLRCSNEIIGRNENIRYVLDSIIMLIMVIGKVTKQKREEESVFHHWLCNCSLVTEGMC